MLFNSLDFLIFFICVYSLYLILNRNLKWQNRMLLVAGYFFYGCWDWRFLGLLLLTTVVDYYCGIKINDSPERSQKKKFLCLSLISNLSVLGFFKYFNFFTESISPLLDIFGLQPHFLNIVLPVGISFYTFQAMSYTIDIYWGKLKPARKFLDYALFVAFFPPLEAGPIERATHLLPQLLKERKLNLNMFYEGCFLILWGLYLKVFVADNLAKIVQTVFEPSTSYDGGLVALGSYAFAFQILGDFAGYSIMAKGLGKLMGFELVWNFNSPYIATNPSEFWQRWHISLSSWLRDYLYIPLGGNRNGTLNTYRNLFLTMLLGGLWHGASMHFVFWGMYHGLLLIGHRLLQTYSKPIIKTENRILQKIVWFAKVLIFFQLTCYGWLLFRADSMTQVFDMTYALVTNFNITSIYKTGSLLRDFAFYTGFFIVVECFIVYKNDLMAVFQAKPVYRAVFYYICFYSIVIFGFTGKSEFIYFQF